MDLEVVTVGNELLLGLTLDTNAAEIARALAGVGARVARQVTVADDERAIRDAVADALRRSRFVIVTGGLGPTSDDRTRVAVARLLDRPLLPILEYCPPESTTTQTTGKRDRCLTSP